MGTARVLVSDASLGPTRLLPRGDTVHAVQVKGLVHAVSLCPSPIFLFKSENPCSSEPGLVLREPPKSYP